MSKNELFEHIELYKKTEKDVTQLDDQFGIRIWDSTKPNFYNNYNLIIHHLLVSIFGEEHTQLIEEYAFDQIDMTFDELCKILNIS